LQLAGKKLFLNLGTYPSFVVFDQVIDRIDHLFISVTLGEKDTNAVQLFPDPQRVLCLLNVLKLKRVEALVCYS
jgi:hypothetical protein